MSIMHMTSSDAPGYCHANRYINNIEGLEVFMAALVTAGQGGWDGSPVTEIGIGLAEHTGNMGNPNYYDKVPAWVQGHCKGGFINGPRFAQREPFIGDFFEHPWIGNPIAWSGDPDQISVGLNVWLSVSMAGATVPGRCDITIRVVCDGQDETRTITSAYDPAYHGLLMITGGFFVQQEMPAFTSAFSVETLTIVEQP